MVVCFRLRQSGFNCQLSLLQTKDIDLKHQGQVVTLESLKSGRIISRKSLNFNRTHWHVAFEIASDVLKGRRNIFGSFRQRSEVFGTSSEMFGNSGRDKKKTSRIWLTKSWQVHLYSKSGRIKRKKEAFSFFPLRFRRAYESAHGSNSITSESSRF